MEDAGWQGHKLKLLQQAIAVQVVEPEELLDETSQAPKNFKIDNGSVASVGATLEDLPPMFQKNEIAQFRSIAKATKIRTVGDNRHRLRRP